MGLVHALQSGSPHKMGFEDGLDSTGWQTAQSEAASSTL